MPGFRNGGFLLGLTLAGATCLGAQPPTYPAFSTAREQRTALAAVGVGTCPPNSAAEETLPEPGASRLKPTSRLPALAHDRVPAVTPSSISRLGSIPKGLTFERSDEEKGLWRLLADEAFPGITDDLRLLRQDSFGTTQTWYVLGKTGSAVLVTGAVAAEGGIGLLGSISPGLTQGPVLLSISQWAGPVGYGALGAYEGFTVWQWSSGWMTDRQFARHQAHFLGGVGLGVAGGLAGAKAGAVSGGFVGAFFGPAGIPVGATIGATVGLLGGGLTGGVVGSGLSRHGINRWFEFKDRQYEAEYVRFLRSHYGLP